MGETLEEVLAHYGIKGMKWGVRRKSGAGSGKSLDPNDPPSKSLGPTKSTSLAGGKSSSDDGPTWSRSGKVLSEDAEKFAVLRAKAKAAGVDSLSTDEIRMLTTRAQALDSYNKTFGTPVQKTKAQVAREFIVEDVIKKTGKSLIQDVAKAQGQRYLSKKGLLPSKGPTPPPANP